MFRAISRFLWIVDFGISTSSRRIPTRRLLPLLAALSMACDGDGGTGPDPAPLVVGVEDPRGDTFATDLSAGLVHPDIIRLRATQGSEELILVVEFADPVESSPESANTAAGLIDLDTDRNAATGVPAATDRFRPQGTGTVRLGVDVGVVVGPDAEVVVVDTRTGAQENLRAEFAGRTITVRLPYARIGGDGDVNLAAVFGTVPEPTDVVPNSNHVAVQADGTVRIGGTTGAVKPGFGKAEAWSPDWSRR